MSNFKTFKTVALLFAALTMSFGNTADAQTNRVRLENHVKDTDVHIVSVQDYFSDFSVTHSSTPPLSYGNENGYSFAHMVDVGAVFQGYQIAEADADYIPKAGESLIYTLRYLKNAVSDAGVLRLSELGNNNRVEVQFNYVNTDVRATAIGTAPAAEILSSHEDAYTIEHIIKFNGWAETDKIVIFPGASATVNSGLNSGFSGDLKLVTVPVSVAPHDISIEDNGIDYISVGGVVEYTNPSLEHLTPTIIPGTTLVPIATGIDLTDAHRIEVYITDNDGDQGTAHSIIMRHFRYDDNEGAIFSWHDNDFFRVRINTADISAGDISISAHGVANFTIESITVYKRAVGVSSRVSEFTFAKSGKTPAQGYLPVNPGTVIDGAVDYPVWASMYPEFVSGSDIVFPDDVADMVIRNLGGGALAEGEFQAFATNVEGITSTDSFSNQFTQDGTRSNVARRGITSSQRALNGGADETRMNNRAYQLYAIVDTYHETIGSPDATSTQSFLEAKIGTHWESAFPADHPAMLTRGQNYNQADHPKLMAKQAANPAAFDISLNVSTGTGPDTFSVNGPAQDGSGVYQGIWGDL